MKCRHCGWELTLPLVDLGSAQPSNAYLTGHSLHMPEKWFPLRVLVCDNCWLVQTEDFAQADELRTAPVASGRLAASLVRPGFPNRRLCER